MMLKISNSSIKQCREKFQFKRIVHTIKNALMMFDLLPIEIIISKSIYCYDNPKLYNVLLYLIRENCNDEKIINELSAFEYKEV